MSFNEQHPSSAAAAAAAAVSSSESSSSYAGTTTKRTRSNLSLEGDVNRNYQDQTTKRVKAANSSSITESDPFSDIPKEDKNWLDSFIMRLSRRFHNILNMDTDILALDEEMGDKWQKNFCQKFSNYPTQQYDEIERYLFCHLLKTMMSAGNGDLYFIKGSNDAFDNDTRVVPFLDHMTMKWIPKSWFRNE